MSKLSEEQTKILRDLLHGYQNKLGGVNQFDIPDIERVLLSKGIAANISLNDGEIVVTDERLPRSHMSMRLIEAHTRVRYDSVLASNICQQATSADQAVERLIGLMLRHIEAQRIVDHDCKIVRKRRLGTKP